MLRCSRPGISHVRPRRSCTRDRQIGLALPCRGRIELGLLRGIAPSGSHGVTLAPGTKVGAYEIVAALGAGGMGEVYRARDTRLGRDVAIKALPPAFAQDPERLARFEREAKLLASLSHPNIGGIYAVEEKDGARLLVMELVEGDTLARGWHAARSPWTKPSRSRRKSRRASRRLTRRASFTVT